MLENFAHLSGGLGAERGVGFVRAARGCASSWATSQPVTPLCSATVAKHVRRDPIEPGKELAVHDDDVLRWRKCLEEDDRSEILCLRPVCQATEEVVVDRLRVALIDLGERLLVAARACLPGATRRSEQAALRLSLVTSP